MEGVDQKEMPYYLMDLARTVTTGALCFWKGNKYGYTYKLEYAGIFEKEAAENIVKSDQNQTTIMIHIDVISNIVRWDLKSYEG